MERNWGLLCVCVCCVPGTVLDLHASFHPILALTPRVNVHIQWALGSYVSCLLYFSMAHKWEGRGTTQICLPKGHALPMLHAISLLKERHWGAHSEDVSLEPGVPTTAATP